MSLSPLSGILTIYTNSPQATIDLRSELPRQDLQLVNIRVHMTSAAASISTGKLFIDLPFLNSNSLLTSFDNTSHLIVTLDNDEVTLYQPQAYINCSKNIPQRFNMTVYTMDGIVIDPSIFTSMTLQFAYQYSFGG